MAWRNQGITGSNNIPLGRRRFGGDDPQDEDSRTATPTSNGGENGYKRGRSPVRGEYPLFLPFFEVLKDDDGLILTLAFSF